MPQILSYTNGGKIVPKVQLNTLFTLRAPKRLNMTLNHHAKALQ